MSEDYTEVLRLALFEDQLERELEHPEEREKRTLEARIAEDLATLKLVRKRKAKAAGCRRYRAKLAAARAAHKIKPKVRFVSNYEF